MLPEPLLPVPLLPVLPFVPFQMFTPFTTPLSEEFTMLTALALESELPDSETLPVLLVVTLEPSAAISPPPAAPVSPAVMPSSCLSTSGFFWPCALAGPAIRKNPAMNNSRCFMFDPLGLIVLGAKFHVGMNVFSLCDQDKRCKLR